MKRSHLNHVALLLLLGGLLAAGTPVHADRLNDALDAKVSLQFEDATLHQVAVFLGTKCGVNILVDNGVIAPIGREVAKPYVTDGSVHRIDLKDVPAREALTVILEPLGLTYAVKENYVWVTTPERINTKPYSDLETQIFEVPDSRVSDEGIGEPQFVMLLRKVIPMVLEPDTGKLLSYMRYNLQTKQLVVYNTAENLTTIRQLVDLVKDNRQTHQL